MLVSPQVWKLKISRKQENGFPLQGTGVKNGTNKKKSGN